MAEIRTVPMPKPEIDGPQSATSPDVPLVLIADARPMLRQSLQGFVETNAQMRVVTAASLRDWLRTGQNVTGQSALPDVILLSVPDGARLPCSPADLAIPAHEPLASVPIIVYSNERPCHEILDLLKIGIRGFIPTSVSTAIAVQALRLVCAGGTFVPSSFLFSLPDAAQKVSEGRGFLTGRELQVVEAIRKGKPNKIIAYELNMCESTVKVHVRAIMKKLKARNRTEVAYLFSSRMDEADGARPE